jgi:GWxTD domain-containing protein
MKRLTVLLFLVTAITVQMEGQGRRGGGGQMHPFVMFEAVNLVSPDSSLSRVDIHYRIDMEFFVPVKNSDPQFPWAFQRKGEILAEIVDSDGMTRERETQQVDRGDHTSERPPDERQWHQGSFSFEVPPGTYTVLFDVNDKESTRRFTDKSRRITAARFRDGEATNSSAVFAKDTVRSLPGQRLTLQNFGGNIRFGSPGSVLLQIPAPDESIGNATAEYTIRAVRDEEEERDTVLTGVVPDVPLQKGVTLQPAENQTSLTYEVAEDSSGSSAWLIVPLPLQRLPLRMFRLSLVIRIGDDEIQVRKPFRTVWPEMPQALRDVDYALEALRYIATEDVIDSLRSGDFETRRDNLEAFWKSKDHSQETAYNEVMTQYYRRVDHARRTFGTLRRPDGFRSDRGRIYILYGPPTSTERSLDPEEGFQEVWMFARLDKKFTFADPGKSGDYVLVSTSTL